VLLPLRLADHWEKGNQERAHSRPLVERYFGEGRRSMKSSTVDDRLVRKVVHAGGKSLKRMNRADSLDGADDVFVRTIASLLALPVKSMSVFANRRGGPSGTHPLPCRSGATQRGAAERHTRPVQQASPWRRGLMTTASVPGPPVETTFFPSPLQATSARRTGALLRDRSRERLDTAKTPHSGLRDAQRQQLRRLE